MTKLKSVEPLPSFEFAEDGPSAMVREDRVMLDISPVTALDIDKVRALRDWLSSVLPAEPRADANSVNTIGVVAPPELPAKSGFEEAFWQIAEVLDLPAMPISPKEAFETVMLPKIREFVAQNRQSEPPVTHHPKCKPDFPFYLCPVCYPNM
jgi:hypothetical protein